MDFLKSMTEFYANEGAEELRFVENSTHLLEFNTAMRQICRFLPANSRILDNCAGGGEYAFSLAEKGHCVTAGDLLPRNVKLLRERQKRTPILRDIYEGDALDLSRFGENEFDAVLCMGALYHLQNPADRRRAVEESLRVLAEDGIFVCTYMNRHAVILGNLRGDIADIAEVMEFAKTGSEGIFYASAPEEMQGLMDGCGLETLCHSALDGMSIFLSATAGLVSSEGLSRYEEYHRFACETPSLLGYSYHNIWIGRRK